MSSAGQTWQQSCQGLQEPSEVLGKLRWSTAAWVWWESRSQVIVSPWGWYHLGACCSLSPHHSYLLSSLCFCVRLAGKTPTLFPSLFSDVWAAGLSSGTARSGHGVWGRRTASSQPFHRKAGCLCCAGGTSGLPLAKCPQWGRRVKLNSQIWQGKLPRLLEQ